MHPDRLVLDSTNIISFCINDETQKFTDLYTEYNIEIFTCPEQIKELRIVFNYPWVKKRLSHPVKHYLELFKSVSKEVKIDLRFDRAPDKNDNYLFDLAYTVKSFYLVTGDHALLNMKQVNKIHIISYTELMRILR